MTDQHHKLGTVVEEAHLVGEPITVLQEKFTDADAIVSYLENGNSLSEIPGIGEKTAGKVMRWLKNNHPDAYRRMHEKDESVFTDFETEEGPCGSEGTDGKTVWGAYCPQDECGHLNLFQGDPDGFGGRPYRCQKCNWVSLMAPHVSNLEVA